MEESEIIEQEVSEGEPQKKNPTTLHLVGKNWRREKIALMIIGGIVVLLSLIFFIFITAPQQTYKVNLIKINHGDTVQKIAEQLDEKSIIKSSTLLRVMLALTFNTDKVKSGVYVFEPRSNLIEVMNAIVNGEYGEAYVWVTIPEGSSNREVASIISKKVSSVNKNEFIRLAKEHEGYLFPDTYHFSKLATEQEVIDQMLKTFDDKTKTLKLQFTPESFHNGIIIASMLEDEAVNIDDASMISGIIQNRLRINMRLQIDATLRYVTGRGSAQLTRADLAMNSPYNTYRNTGLPPTPIGNPGFEMITAALYPKKNDYIFYLHANDGTPYYAVTHDEHVRNKSKYLK